MRNSRNVWNHNIQTRSIYKNVFNQAKPQEIEQTQNMERLIQINDWRNTFYSNDMRANLTLKNCINTIAKYVAMLRPVHISNDKETGGKTPTQSNLQQLLELRPNAFMSSYDFLYKTCIQLLTNKNSYISIQRDENGNIISLWPLEYSYCETKEINGNVFLQYTFQNSVSGEQRKVINYEDIIHLRYDFSNGELISYDKYDYLQSDLQLLDTLKQSFGNSALNSGGIRGVAKISGSIGQENWAKKSEIFSNQLKNNTGVISTDSTIDFIPVANSNPVPADTSQLEFIRGEIYRYFGISESIISGKYTENEWDSFYNSTIKPIAKIFSQEFSQKIFTARELGFGNRIIFESNSLNYSDIKTKTEMIKELRPLGILTTNQCLEIMGLPPVSDGDDRIQSLNNANVSIISEYQLNKAAKEKKVKK